MIAWKSLAALALTLLLTIAVEPPAQAQQYTITSVTTTDLGNVASASTGTSTFRTAPSSGTVTKVSGSAVRLTAGSARSLVTISCTSTLVPALCDLDVTVNIAQTGTPTNRASALQNFTVSAGSTTIKTAPGTGNNINFTLPKISAGTSANFWVGFDFPLRADDAGVSSGISTANFSITASTITILGTGTGSGAATAKVFRSLSLTNSTPLAFGRIIRPRTGSGTVSMATTGVVTTSGGPTKMPSPASTAASFTANGEGGQSFSVSVPTSFNLVNGANTIVVTLAPSVSGNQTMSGTLGSAGTLPILVGGSFPLASTTALGTYTGSFSVTVTYN
jgi:hypothetical protein